MGDAIRSLRIDHGYGVEELVQDLQLRGCDITRQCLYKIESGKHHVTVELLRQLKDLFEISHEDFYKKFFDFKGEE